VAPFPLQRTDGESNTSGGAVIWNGDRNEPRWKFDCDDMGLVSAAATSGLPNGDDNARDGGSLSEDMWWLSRWTASFTILLQQTNKRSDVIKDFVFKAKTKATTFKGKAKDLQKPSQSQGLGTKAKGS